MVGKRKDHLKEILVDKKNYFTEGEDYIITKVILDTGNGRSRRHDITITPSCMKELAMMCHNERGKQVRRYFLELERIVRIYNHDLKQAMKKKIEKLERNQKSCEQIENSKINNKKEGVVYVFEALNNVVLPNNIVDEIYKIGRTENKKKRFKVYNCGNAYDIEILYYKRVSNAKDVEDCLKKRLDRDGYKFRKYKELYKVDLNTIKSIVDKCADIDKILAMKKGIYNKNNDDNSKQLYLSIDYQGYGTLKQATNDHPKKNTCKNKIALTKEKSSKKL